MIFKKNLLFLYDNQFVFSIKNSFKVRVKGAEKTTISFVKKLLNTIESQPLDSIVLQEDIVRLKRLPSIAHAYYQVFYSHNNLYTY